MEAILASRDQYQIIHASQVKKLLSEGLEEIPHVKNKQEQHLNDDLEEIEQLTKQVATLKEKLQRERQVLEANETNFTKQQTALKELEHQKRRYNEENHVLNNQKNKLISIKPNIHDQKLLESGQKRLTYYRDFTGIRWDYGALEESVKGYVTNKTDYIRHFSYENENMNTLAENLWKEIELSTKEHSTIACDKENIANN